MDLTLPLDYAAIERILPHRYPFLLVDRIIELEVDKRIVGIKNVSLNERYLWRPPNGSPVLPPTILTDAPPLLRRHRARAVSPPGSSRRRGRHRSQRDSPAQPNGYAQRRRARERPIGRRGDHDVRAGARPVAWHGLKTAPYIDA